jgi:chaperonin cofactor prefoldin
MDDIVAVVLEKLEARITDLEVTVKFLEDKNKEMDERYRLAKEELDKFNESLV